MAKPTIQKKNLIVFLLLSFPFAGFGHLYLGYLKWGLTFIATPLLWKFLCENYLEGTPEGYYFSISSLWVIWLGIQLDGIFRLVTFRYPKEQRAFQRWYYFPVYILIFLIVYSVLCYKRYRLFKIPSRAMIPTLQVNDHILVDLDAYENDEPKRGDVIVFRFPQDESVFYVKRVIGIPGDILEIREKRILLNKKKVPLKKISLSKCAFQDSRYNKKRLECYEETMGETKHLLLFDKDNFIGANFGPVANEMRHQVVATENGTIKPGSEHIEHEKPRNKNIGYFVMGDNRDYSNDSRFWGYVPEKNVIGKVLHVPYSLQIFDSGRNFRPKFDRDRMNILVK